MNVKLVLDPGSTHMGKKRYCKELIDIASSVGAYAIKFQLFPNEEPFVTDEHPNIPMPYDWFGEMFRYGERVGVMVTASVFDHKAVDVVASYPVPFIKFSYGRQNDLSHINGLLNIGKKVVVSSDMMKVGELPQHENLTKLFCQPVYPTMWHTNFETLFKKEGGPFDGLSDHSLGYFEVEQAISHGALWIEKHIKLEYNDVVCPDAKFALGIDKLQEMVKQIDVLQEFSLNESNLDVA